METDATELKSDLSGLTRTRCSEQAVTRKCPPGRVRFLSLEERHLLLERRRAASRMSQVSRYIIAQTTIIGIGRTRINPSLATVTRGILLAATGRAVSSHWLPPCISSRRSGSSVL